MLSPAAALGRFIGGMLSECAPILTEIIANAIRKAFTDTVEDSAGDPALRRRLLDQLHTYQDGIGPLRDTGSAPGSSEG